MSSGGNGCYVFAMEFTIRRVRRGDLAAIRDLVSKVGVPVPDETRATLSRFRRIVADLGADFYVATQRNKPAGFFHVSYSRDLLEGSRAQLLALVAIQNECRAQLAEAACKRAAKRGCREMTVVPGPWTQNLEDAAISRNWPRAACFLVDLPADPGQSDAVS